MPAEYAVRDRKTNARDAAVGFGDLCGGREQPQCQFMTNFTELTSVPLDRLVPFTDQLRLAVAAYLARFKDSSRDHTESDLRCFLAWCADRGLEPRALNYRDRRHQLERSGIGSASAARHWGGSKGSAKYCVSWATRPPENSMMLTEWEGTPS